MIVGMTACFGSLYPVQYAESVATRHLHVQPF
ncbi:MAG: hypothetical protein JWM68_924, partial [Verrucomicrobiales bacterium]|nr:hypothetical protein [Verrucomicrobiales bacterium]